METTLPLPFLISVDVPPNWASGEEGQGLNREEVSCLGCVFFEVTQQNFEELINHLEQLSAAALHIFFDATGLESKDDVVTLLDHGAQKVFVQPERLTDFTEFGRRVAPAVRKLNQLSSGTEHGLLLKDFDQTGCDIAGFMESSKATKMPPLYIKPIQDTIYDHFVDICSQLSAIPIIPSTELTIKKEAEAEKKISVPKLFSVAWRSDRPDKLLPTVVCDEGGVALGLVYSSEESVAESLRTKTGVYQSRKRGLWYKGATSGDTQELVRISMDCDNDALKFVVKQKGKFCHLDQHGCFGDLKGISKLEHTLVSRKQSAPDGSYTKRLFSDEKLLRAKIMEEAEELCNAQTPEEVSFEAADLIYFALTKAVGAGVSLSDIEENLDAKSLKVKRRPGNAKGQWAQKEGITNGITEKAKEAAKDSTTPLTSAPVTAAHTAPDTERITLKRVDTSKVSAAEVSEALRRPSQKSADAIMNIVTPIVNDIRQNGDKALLSYTHKFERATSLTSPVLKAPFPQSLMNLSPETINAIDISFENIRKFHAAQKEQPLKVETMPGVVCSRFSRPIERVGLYVPGGTAVLPSTALMLGVPAMVAGCQKIVIASPPRSDGSITPEIVYAAHKVGAESIVLAGGAQAVAAMAYGTESVSKVDKILGPGNQFVTAAKMFVSNDTNAGVSIDMPAGPSEVLVVADKEANPAFVASDLLSQAEHGVDSQVVCIAVDMDEQQLQAIEDEVHKQAMALPRVNIVRGAINHSVTFVVKDVEEAMKISNDYAPEHLILQIKDAEGVVDKVMNAGSVFIGQWTPESVGDYSAGVNHSLPTYGYAKQYSGVNLGSFLKHITSSNLTAEGLRNVGGAVMQLAKVEELEAHRRAVSIRLSTLTGKQI
ncbi:histidine biosynthesis trifunctional-protein [Jackrogersella minutella]|nr:histidine biosynthesis trifunctional-protein [Jackrogersella minutella]